MQTAYKSIRLFQNSFLEKFSHIHPLTPLVVWGPVVAFLYWRSLSVWNLGLATVFEYSVAGLLVWTLAEYVLHRWIFHYHPKGEWQERIVFVMHGIHHSDPVDPTRLVMPPIVALILAVVFYSIFRLALGVENVEPFFGAFIFGYLCYDYIHFSVHHFKPRTRVGRFLKQSHMIHHYVNPELRWGVSTPLWDVVFGTYAEPSRKSAAVGQKRTR